MREFLFSFIEDMAHQLLPAFEFADSPALDYQTFEFDYSQNQFSPEQCKSFWKRLKKWTVQFKDWVHDLYLICKGVNDIKKAYQAWQKENDHHVSYDEFKRHYNYYNFNNQ